MRHTMHTEPTFAAIPTQPTQDALALSAQKTTREAIARWTGKASCAGAVLPRDTSRVSPQARWLAETQRGLAAFFEDGGFAQFEGAGAPLPDMLMPSHYAAYSREKMNACMD
jgi:hypothetical protein